MFTKQREHHKLNSQNLGGGGGWHKEPLLGLDTPITMQSILSCEDKDKVDRLYAMKMDYLNPEPWLICTLIKYSQSRNQWEWQVKCAIQQSLNFSMAPSPKSCHTFRIGGLEPFLDLSHLYSGTRPLSMPCSV